MKIFINSDIIENCSGPRPLFLKIMLLQSNHMIYLSYPWIRCKYYWRLDQVFNNILRKDNRIGVENYGIILRWHQQGCYKVIITSHQDRSCRIFVKRKGNKTITNQFFHIDKNRTFSNIRQIQFLILLLIPYPRGVRIDNFTIIERQQEHRIREARRKSKLHDVQ